jgi:hypothetical protein
MNQEEKRKRHKEAQQRYYDSKLKQPCELKQDKKSLTKREYDQRHKEEIKTKRRARYATKGTIRDTPRINEFSKNPYIRRASPNPFGESAGLLSLSK